MPIEIEPFRECDCVLRRQNRAPQDSRFGRVVNGLRFNQSGQLASSDEERAVHMAEIRAFLELRKAR